MVNAMDRGITLLLHNKVECYSMYFMGIVKLIFIRVLRLIVECRGAT